ncbi:MAG: YqgE/AlgH family protein, partial [Bacteroidales bacterium]|nr:YqgE/AlgH family protein [Bacteroidales bacterium]
MKSGLITDKQIKFFLGYSGWMANQLESELERNSWVVAN